MKKKLLHPGGRWETAGRHLGAALEKMKRLGVAQSDVRAYGTGPVSMATARKVVESNRVEWFNNIEELMASRHTDRNLPWGPEGVTTERPEEAAHNLCSPHRKLADPKVRLRRPGSRGCSGSPNRSSTRPPNGGFCR